MVANYAFKSILHNDAAIRPNLGLRGTEACAGAVTNSGLVQAVGPEACH
jgi:hypothetical protein